MLVIILHVLMYLKIVLIHIYGLFCSFLNLLCKGECFIELRLRYGYGLIILKCCLWGISLGFLFGRLGLRIGSLSISGHCRRSGLSILLVICCCKRWILQVYHKELIISLMLFRFTIFWFVYLQTLIRTSPWLKTKTHY